MTLTPVAQRTDDFLATDVLVELPAQLLLAAAGFASRDAAKPNLTVIQITADANQLVIRAVNGHIAYRCCIPSNLYQLHPNFSQSGNLIELQLPAEPLRKTCAKANIAAITPGAIQLLDAKRNTVDLRPSSWVPNAQFPALDTLWPDEFSFDPGQPLGFNASYIETVAQVVKRLSTNGTMALSFNTHHTACVINADAEIEHGGAFTAVNLEFLIMPVQMNARAPIDAADRLVEAFNRKPKEQRDGITAKLNSSFGAYGVSFHKDKGLLYTAHTLAQAKTLMTYIAGA